MIFKLKKETSLGIVFFLIAFILVDIDAIFDQEKTEDLITCPDNVTRCKETHSCCPFENSFGWKKSSSSKEAYHIRRLTFYFVSYNPNLS